MAAVSGAETNLAYEGQEGLDLGDMPAHQAEAATQTTIKYALAEQGQRGIVAGGVIDAGRAAQGHERTRQLAAVLAYAHRPRPPLRCTGRRKPMLAQPAEVKKVVARLAHKQSPKRRLVFRG